MTHVRRLFPVRMQNVRRAAALLVLCGVGLACVAGEPATHRFLLLEDGRVWGWGNNAWGQLDSALPANVQQPAEVPAQAGAKQLATGARHTLALSPSGAVTAWGDNTSGQLGAPPARPASGKVDVALPKPAQAIAAGAHHSLALLSDGSVWGWGANQRGQLARKPLGPFAQGLPPAPIAGIPRSVLSLAAGTDFSVALLATGEVWLWGAGNPSPTHVRLPLPAVAVKAHGPAAVVRDRTGRAWRWTPPGTQLSPAAEPEVESLEALPLPSLQIEGQVAARTPGRASVTDPGSCSAVQRSGRFTCTVPFGWKGAIAFRPAKGGVDRRFLPLLTGPLKVDFTIDEPAGAERPAPPAAQQATGSMASGQGAETLPAPAAPNTPSPASSDPR